MFARILGRSTSTTQSTQPSIEDLRADFSSALQKFAKCIDLDSFQSHTNLHTASISAREEGVDVAEELRLQQISRVVKNALAALPNFKTLSDSPDILDTCSEEAARTIVSSLRSQGAIPPLGALDQNGPKPLTPAEAFLATIEPEAADALSTVTSLISNTRATDAYTDLDYDLQLDVINGVVTLLQEGGIESLTAQSFSELDEAHGLSLSGAISW